MRTAGSTASVIAAIREDAAAEVERIEQAALAGVTSIRDAPIDVTIADREQQLAAARRACEEAIARQEWEGRRAVIEQREKWIHRVIDESGGCAAALQRIAEEAVAQVGSNCTLTIGGDVSFGENVTIVRKDIDGCIASNGDVTFDNTHAARSRRFEPLWRKALAEMYRP